MITIYEGLFDDIKQKLFGWTEPGGLGWQLQNLAKRIRTLKGTLKLKKMSPEEESKLRQQLQRLQKEYSELKEDIESNRFARLSANFDSPPVFHKGLVQKVGDKLADHPIATGVGGALALGAGALLARKLWKRRQQQKQQKTA